MENLKISSAQFEHKSGDKKYNLQVIDTLAAKAASEGSKVIAFHECSITGYSFARNLSREQLLEISELIPGGESIQQLISISKKNDMVVLAGLFEKDADDNIFK